MIMTQTEYEQKKRECWEELCRANPSHNKSIFARKVFDYAFDRAYALGKQGKDTEGEEMLIVPRKKVQELYKKFRKDGSNACLYAAATLDALFGSKCLPDEAKDTPNVDSSESNVDTLADNVDSSDSDSLAHLEPKAKSDFTPIPEKTFVSNWDKSESKPAEPKFKVGDKVFYVCSITVKHKCTVTKVMQNEHSGKWEYNVLFDYGKPGLYISESDLEPYTEPEKEYRNLSKNIVDCDKQFDNILKDSFSKERRLNIATRIMAAILSNQMMLNNLAHGETTAEGVVRCVVDTTMMYADALIAKCEK